MGDQPLVKSYRENAHEDFWADFLYLFDNGKWLVFGSNGDWVEVKLPPAKAGGL